MPASLQVNVGGGKYTIMLTGFTLNSFPWTWNGCTMVCNKFSSVPSPLDFPGASDGKEFACHVGDLGSIPGLGRSPGGGHGNPLQYSCLENPLGQRCLAGYSPRCGKESDMTEQLSMHSCVHTRMHTHTHTHVP